MAAEQRHKNKIYASTHAAMPLDADAAAAALCARAQRKDMMLIRVTHIIITRMDDDNATPPRHDITRAIDDDRLCALPPCAHTPPRATFC